METDERLSLKKASWSIFIVSFIIYVVISMTKSAYSASMASIIGEGIFTTSSAGIVNTGFYIFYGGGQLLGVGVVDKISPVKLIYMSLVGTFIAIIGMAISNSLVSMLIFWSFCGLAQFAIWPAILRVIAEYVLIEQRQKAMIMISFAYCVGMLLNYLMASVVLSISNWRMLFILSGAIVILSMIAWFLITRKNKEKVEDIRRENWVINQKYSLAKEKNATESQTGFLKIIAISGVIFLLVPAVLRSAMDLGLKTWVPKMMIDIYGVSEGLASSFTTVLVAVNLAGVFIAGFITQRITKNTVLAFGICFIVSLPFNILLLFTGKIHITIVVLLLTIITTMMYAGHQLINVVIPSSFAKYNKTGSVAAMLNAIAAFGNAATTYGFGYIAGNYGWSKIMEVLVVFAVVSVIFTLIAMPMWAKFSGSRMK